MFHCSVIKVRCLAATFRILSLRFRSVKNFFKFFHFFFRSVVVSLTTWTLYHVFSLLSTIIFIILKTIRIVCLFNTIHLTTGLEYHFPPAMSTIFLMFFVNFANRDSAQQIHKKRSFYRPFSHVKSIKNNECATVSSLSRIQIRISIILPLLELHHQALQDLTFLLHLQYELLTSAYHMIQFPSFFLVEDL